MRNIQTAVISTPTENWTHVYMNLFTRNSPYYHLLKYLLFLPKQPAYIYIHTQSVPGGMCHKYTDITQNTYVQSWTVTEIMAREVWNFDSC